MAGILDRIPLPDNLVSFEELLEDYPDLTVPILEELAQSVNVPVQRLRVQVPGRASKRKVIAVGMKDLEKIEESYRPYLEEEFNSNQIISIWRLARILKSTPETLLKAADENEIEPNVYEFANHMRTVGFDRPQRILLRQTLAAQRGKIADESIHPFDSVRVELKIGRPKLQSYCDVLGIELEKYLFGMTYGYGLTDEQYALVVEHHENQEIKPAPANVVSVTRAAKSRKMTPATLFELIEGTDVKTKTYLVQGVPQECLTNEDIVALEAAYDPEIMKLILPVPVRSYARSQRVKPQVILDLAEGAGVKLKTYYFGSKQSIGITPDQIKEIDKAYEGYPRIPLSDESILSLKTVAREEHIDSRTLTKLLNGTDLEVGTYRFPNGKTGQGLRREQVDELREAYRPFN